MHTSSHNIALHGMAFWHVKVVHHRISSLLQMSLGGRNQRQFSQVEKPSSMPSIHACGSNNDANFIFQNACFLL